MRSNRIGHTNFITSEKYRIYNHKPDMIIISLVQKIYIVSHFQAITSWQLLVANMALATDFAELLKCGETKIKTQKNS